MINSGKNQLSLLLQSENPETILNEVQTIFFYHYPIELFDRVEHVFEIICALFRGDYKGYRKCNTEYHNLKHTLDAFLAAARLIDGFNIKSGAISGLKMRNLLIAALLHDTGYIQEDDDLDGTGAKYTKVHVKRSIEFTVKNADIIGITSDDIKEISSFISFTGLKADDLPDLDGVDTVCGKVLGTADLIGQMSDRAYLEKLLFLYYEFKEAGMEGFDTTFDILRNTLGFYEITMDRLNNILSRSYELAEIHFRTRYEVENNLYMSAIDKQMDYLKTIIEDESTNFRSKLKRLNIEEIEGRYKNHPH